MFVCQNASKTSYCMETLLRRRDDLKIGCLTFRTKTKGDLILMTFLCSSFWDTCSEETCHFFLLLKNISLLQKSIDGKDNLNIILLLICWSKSRSSGRSVTFRRGSSNILTQKVNNAMDVQQENWVWTKSTFVVNAKKEIIKGKEKQQYNERRNKDHSKGFSVLKKI